jgi:hypothetical protein
MNPDTELENWRREWQSEAEVPRDLRARVERQSRWMRIVIAADILVTVVIGGGTVALAVRAPQPDMVLLAAATWLFIAAAWTFRLVADRGLWSRPAMNTAAFVELLVRRCRARLKATLFAGVLYVCEMAFCLGWIYRHSAGRTALGTWLFFSSAFIDMVWLVTLVFFAFVFWYRRKKRAELVWLRRLID